MSARQDHVNMRFHPVFLNPNVSKDFFWFSLPTCDWQLPPCWQAVASGFEQEGESLDDYLWREFGFTKDAGTQEVKCISCFFLQAIGCSWLHVQVPTLRLLESISTYVSPPCSRNDVTIAEYWGPAS